MMGDAEQLWMHIDTTFSEIDAITSGRFASPQTVRISRPDSPVKQHSPHAKRACLCHSVPASAGGSGRLSTHTARERAVPAGVQLLPWALKLADSTCKVEAFTGFDIHRHRALPEVEETAVRESEEEEPLTLPAATASCVYCASRGKIHRRQSLDLLTMPMPMSISAHSTHASTLTPQPLPHADAWACSLVATNPHPCFLLLLSHRCMRLSSCGQVWKRGAKKRKLKKDAHASTRVEAGATHPPKPLDVPRVPRATLHTKGAQGLPPRRVERGVCSMVKRPPRVLGNVRVGSCASASGRRPVVAPTATASGACEPAAFKRSSNHSAWPRPGVTTRSGPIAQRQALHEWPFPVIVPPEALW